MDFIRRESVDQHLTQIDAKSGSLPVNLRVKAAPTQAQSCSASPHLNPALTCSEDGAEDAPAAVTVTVVFPHFAARLDDF